MSWFGRRDADAAGATPVPGWKLTLPVAGDRGTAATRTPARPEPPWLVRDAAGALTFWAPVCGATTPNSTHARTELVGLDTFPAGLTRQALTASIVVARVPRGKPVVIVGQIHGAGEIRSVPFVMLRYAAGAVRVIVKLHRSGPDAARFALLSDVPLGARFDYRISDDGDGNLSFQASCDGRTGAASTPVPAAFHGAPVRFQAGAYQLADSAAGTGDPDDGAVVTFHTLSAGPQGMGR